MKNLVDKIKSQLKGIDKADLTKAEKNILRLIEEEGEKKKDLEQLLEDWSVMEPSAWENETGPKDWYAVCNDDGIIAYFRDEADAFKYRLSKINDILNG